MRGGVRKRGEKWYYYFEAGIVNGKRKKIERVGGKTQREALKKLREVLSEFDNTGKIIIESTQSLSDYLNYWMKEHVNLNCKYKTIELYKFYINNHINPSLGNYKLTQLNHILIQQFINDLHKKDYSRNTIKGILSVLKISLQMAVIPYDLLKDNSATNVKIPKQTINDEVKSLTFEEYSKIIEYYKFGTYQHLMLQISFTTGLRKSEVLGLTWDCIEFENRTLRVDKLLTYRERIYVIETLKTKSSYRTIKISNSLLNLLKKYKIIQGENKLLFGEYYKDNNYIGPDKKVYSNIDFVVTKKDGSLINTGNVSNITNMLKKHLNIDFHFHMLRHTHATMLLEAGANIKDIQSRLGHKNINTTLDTYSHVTDKMQDETVNIIEEIQKSIK